MGKIKKIGIGFGIVTLGVFILIIVVGLTYTPTEKIQEKNTDLTKLSTQELDEIRIGWKYDDIMRNTEKYEGEVILFDGEITSVNVHDSNKNRYSLQVKVQCDDWPDIYDCDYIFVDYTGNRLLDGDIVEVYGQVLRIYDYRTISGSAAAAPLVKSLDTKCTSC